MRRSTPGLLPLLLLLTAAAFPIGRAVAQDPATPTAPVATSAPLREVLIQTTLEALPPPPTVVRLLRITLPAGASLPLHTLDGPELLHVEAGAVTVRLEGDAVVAPAGDPGTPRPARLAPIGQEFGLVPGDQLAIPVDVPVAFRNDGSDPTTLLTALFVPADEERPPELRWVDGTPTAETLGGTTSRVLGNAVATAWPAGPLVVVVERLALPPGRSIPGQGGPLLLAVEAGGFSFALVEGSFQVARGVLGVEPAATPDAAYALSPGDSVFFPESVSDVPRPDDRRLLVLLRLSVLPVEAGSPNGTPSTEPTPDEPAAPTAAATETAAEAPTDPTTASGFAVGATVLVSETGVRLRTAPATDAEVAAEFFAGRELIVTGPPQESDGLVWYPVAAADDPTVVGYIAEEFLRPASS